MDLVHRSPTLQYRRELFSAGLIDNPHHPCGLAERRKLCREYVNKWTGTAKVARKIHEVPVEHPTLGWNHIAALGGDLFALHHPYRHDCFKVLHVPPGVSQRPVEGWSIPQFPFEVLCSTTYAPGNLLAVAERRGQ
jgi:hypothetical protein